MWAAVPGNMEVGRGEGVRTKTIGCVATSKNIRNDSKDARNDPGKCPEKWESNRRNASSLFRRVALKANMEMDLFLHF